MTDLPTDPLDAYERPLTRAVRRFSDQAVVPINAADVAHTAIADARPPSLAERLGGVWSGAGMVGRLGTVAAAGLLAVAAAAVIGGGSSNVVPVTTSGPDSTTATSAGVVMCSPIDIDARIVSWDGAAGHRIATVDLLHGSDNECSVDTMPTPWLADGNGKELIVGHGSPGPTISLKPGDLLHTLVQVGNYCGPRPKAPVTLAFTEGDRAIFVATPLTPTDVTGVPPCNGEQGPKDDIEMQPWSR